MGGRVVVRFLPALSPRPPKRKSRQKATYAGFTPSGFDMTRFAVALLYICRISVLGLFVVALDSFVTSFAGHLCFSR